MKWAAFGNDIIKVFAKRNHETEGQMDKSEHLYKAGQIQKPAQNSFFN